MTRALLAAPVLGVLLVGYWPHVRDAGFVYEDRLVVRSPTERRPLTAWTWSFTQTPQAAHAMSLGLLLALSVGVGALAWRLGLSQLASLAAGAVVLVHPLTVEATAYAASRYELMAALGIVGACLIAAGGIDVHLFDASTRFVLRRRPGAMQVVARLRRRWFGGAMPRLNLHAPRPVPQPFGPIVNQVPAANSERHREQYSALSWCGIAACLLCAMASKETAIVGLVLVPLTAWAARTRTTRDAWMWYGLAVYMGLLAAIRWVDPGADGWRWLVNIGEAQGLTITAGEWALKQAAATLRIVGIAVTGHGMTVDADIDAIPLLLQWIAVAACLTIAAAPLWLRTRAPLMAFGLAWFTLSLLPRFIIQTPRSYLNEHQVLVPFIGLILASAALMGRRAAA